MGGCVTNQGTTSRCLDAHTRTVDEEGAYPQHEAIDLHPVHPLRSALPVWMWQGCGCALLDGGAVLMLLGTLARVRSPETRLAMVVGAHTTACWPAGAV